MCFLFDPFSDHKGNWEYGNAFYFLFDPGFDQHIYKQLREFLQRKRDGRNLPPWCFSGSSASDKIIENTEELGIRGAVQSDSQQVFSKHPQGA